MRTSGLAGAVAAAALLGLLAPAGAGAATPTGRAAAELITFDTGTAPCHFVDTVPLRDEYASLGVHFAGPSADTGGAILDGCGSFGVDPRSGTEFLAFSQASYAMTPERISFDDLQKKVSMYVANGFGTGTSTYKLIARRDGDVVARKTLTTAEIGWLAIKVSDRRGIDEVELTATTPDGAFVVDDLKLKAR